MPTKSFLSLGAAFLLGSLLFGCGSDAGTSGDAGTQGDAGARSDGGTPALVSDAALPAADVRGRYVGNLVNGASTCPGDWNVADKSEVTVEVTQVGNTVGAEVTGASGLFLDLALGTNTFSGTANGDQLALSLVGTSEKSQGECKYTWRADFSGRITGNTLEGTITYRPQTGAQADCAAMAVQGCSRTQVFNGVRPASR